MLISTPTAPSTAFRVGFTIGRVAKGFASSLFKARVHRASEALAVPVRTDGFFDPLLSAERLREFDQVTAMQRAKPVDLNLWFHANTRQLANPTRQHREQESDSAPATEAKSDLRLGSLDMLITPRTDSGIDVAALDENLDLAVTHALVRELFSKACSRFSNYETMVAKEFGRLMRHTFGEDEHSSPKAIAAFKHAREKYQYLSLEEEEQMDNELHDDGLCGHGLDFWTCPCGCFEGD